MKASDAIIVWNGVDEPNYPRKGVVEVLEKSQYEAVREFHSWIGAWEEDGKPAGDGTWRRASSQERLERLTRAYDQMTTVDGIDAAKAREALMRIDEYRAAFG